jgi:hypothetical protein
MRLFTRYVNLQTTVREIHDVYGATRLAGGFRPGATAEVTAEVRGGIDKAVVLGDCLAQELMLRRTSILAVDGPLIRCGRPRWRRSREGSLEIGATFRGFDDHTMRKNRSIIAQCIDASQDPEGDRAAQTLPWVIDREPEAVKLAAAARSLGGS